MNLTELTADDFRRLAGLAEKRERLNTALARIDAQLAAIGKGAKKPVKVTRRRKAKRAPRGQVKGKILGVLKAAGKAGATIKDLSVKTGLSVQRLHSWFFATGRKIKGVKKLGPGKYGWVE